MIVSCDMGGSADPTAMVVLDPKGRDLVDMVALERFPLGVPYRRQHERIVQTARSVNASACVIDATGIGKPQVQSLIELFADRDVRCPVFGVTITAGKTVGGSWFDVTVPKRDLIATAQVEIEHGRLRVAEGLPLADVLIRELQSYRFKVTSHGSDSYGNGTGRGDSDHDDTVLALAIGLWFIEHRGSSPVGVVVPADAPKLVDLAAVRAQRAATVSSAWFGRR